MLLIVAMLILGAVVSCIGTIITVIGSYCVNPNKKINLGKKK